jgi:two-component system NtrC family response regulator
MVRAGDFREDLFFRLNVVAITLPPLRERREDVPLLVDHFLRRYADEGRARAVSREAMDLLLKHDYPGNVRELENLVHRAVVLARGETVTTADLPLHVLGLKPEPKASETGGFAERVRAFERALILEALDKAGGVQTRAAAALGMSERHLRYKLKKYRLAPAARTGGDDPAR